MEWFNVSACVIYEKIGFLLLNNLFIFVLGHFYLSMTQVLVDLSIEALVWFLVYFEMLPEAGGKEEGKKSCLYFIPF